MCLIVFAWQQHARWPLLLAANRDEFHERPAAAADFWEDRPQILAGRDLEAGGTWLGVTPGGRFAAITNVRDPLAGEHKAPRSRGELTVDFLSGSQSPAAYLESLAPRSDDYLGFNLLVSDGHSMHYLHAGEPEPKALSPGIYGLSNAALDVPWPKVELAKQRLAAQVVGSAYPAPEHNTLRDCTADRTLADEKALAAHGLEGEMAVALSSQFIVTPIYGTRCMTTLRMGGDDRWDFQEQRFGANGESLGQSDFGSDS